LRFEVSPGKQFETLAPKYPTQKMAGGVVQVGEHWYSMRPSSNPSTATHTHTHTHTHKENIYMKNAQYK
jgi:hypothetical protein